MTFQPSDEHRMARLPRCGDEFYVLVAGFYEQKPFHCCYNNKDRYSFNFVMNGKGKWRVDHGPWRDIEAPMTWLNIPGHHYEFGPDSHWSEYYISFNGRVVDHWKASGLFNLSQEPSTTNSAHSFKRIFDKILLLEHHPSELRGTMMKHAIEELLITRSIEEHNSPITITDPIHHRIVKACQKEIYGDIDFHRLAHDLGCSYSSLRKRIKQTFGMAPKQYFIKLKMETAKTLITQADLSMGDIAIKMGYKDLYSFSRAFKTSVGLSPSEYRKVQI